MLPVIIEKLKSKKTVNFTPFGSSMLPLIRDGKDNVTIKQCEVYKKYDICLFLKDGNIVLHRIIRTKDRFVARGDNTYKKETDIEILGKVVKLVRRGKEVNLNGFFYKAYSILWHKLFFARLVLFKIKRRLKSI